MNPGVRNTAVAVALGCVCCVRAADGVERRLTQGPVTVALLVDRTEINAAGAVRLTVSVGAEEGWAVTAPAVGEKLGEFTVAAREEGSPELRGGRVTVERRYTLEPFLPGAYAIPALEVGYAKPGQPAGTLKTEPVAIKVVSLVAEDAKLDPGPIRGVVSPEATRGWAIPIGVGVLALGLAGGAGVLVARRRRKDGRSGGPTAALDELRARAGGLSTREVCERGSVLIRAALAGRIAGAAAMTAEELLGRAPHLPITAHEAESLRRFLRTADLVRFAGEEADGAALQGDLVALCSIARALADGDEGARP